MAGSTPKIIITGATGRAGSGALSFAKSLGLSPVEWDSSDTKHKGPFPELLAFDIMIHAVRIRRGDDSKPFLTQELIRSESRKLSVVVDISCDISGATNRLPIHSRCTTFEKPVARVLKGGGSVPPLDVIAIPNLPTLLPKESSATFSRQLLACLLQLAKQGWAAPVWQRCIKNFERVSRTIRPVATPFFAAQSAALTPFQGHVAAALAQTPSLISLLPPSTPPQPRPAHRTLE